MASLSDPRISNPVLSSLKIQSNDRIIFIRENALADSNFIITHLLKQFFYEKSRVCFLTLHNTLDHYQNVGKKLGYDLKEAIECNNIKIVDPLADIVEGIGKEIEESFEESQMLKCLFLSIKKHIDNYCSLKDCPVYLVIDDVSHFLDLAIDLSQIISFINYCINLTNNDNISVVINAHVGSKNDEIVAKSVQHICDVFVEISQLKTGKSTDITGLMTIQRGDSINNYHYRTFDRGVKTFHPGETIYNLYK
ncbi:elongator complex protein 6-like [Sitophilus oryzae]|uniref:Elongator complex protein 6 n=1 Tax=Sitophilus oryzae TaxID=7048 RepID=A0A6J2XXD8_SITOR|nr:elongator complex protein 6-like [Sitophilus oryzae]XP_030755305.1 elongator complex protein 6-like [Sitophilus oryzae]